jgi:hypothetical protein
MLMIVKEQGVKIAAAMLALIVPFAFFVGGLLNHALRLAGRACRMNHPDHSARVPLSFLLPGARARVESIDDAVDAAQREQLIAYGLAANRPLVVSAATPDDHRHGRRGRTRSGSRHRPPRLGPAALNRTRRKSRGLPSAHLPNHCIRIHPAPLTARCTTCHETFFRPGLALLLRIIIISINLIRRPSDARTTPFRAVLADAARRSLQPPADRFR